MTSRRLQSLQAERSLTPMVLLPGTLCDERVFAPLLEALGQANVRTLLLTDAAQMDALRNKILERAPPRFVAVGFSLGGIAALELAAAAPERVAGLVLISTTARPVAPAAKAGRRALVDEARVRGIEAVVTETLWRSYVAPKNQRNAALLGIIQKMAIALGVEVFNAQTEAALGRRDFRDQLAGLQIPTLVIGGARDMVCPPDHQSEVAALFRDSRLRLIPDAGHFVLLEAPQEVSAIIVDWLKAVFPSSPASQHRLYEGVSHE